MSTAMPARPPEIKADCIVGFGLDITLKKNISANPINDRLILIAENFSQYFE
jgi:hypothetical protein